MSGEDTFIGRWSRLKQRAADEKKKPPAGAEAEDWRAPHHDIEPAAVATDRPGKLPATPIESEPPFDPASLPPIESIVAGTDIRAFLQKGVPAALTKAALRRAWTADPAIRDFIEVAENQWDFTDPTAIPGFGPLQATDNLRQLVGQALGNLPEAPDAADASKEGPDTIAHAKPVADAARKEAPAEVSGRSTPVASLRESADSLDTADDAASQQPEPAREVGSALRRKGHGSAMPR